MTHAHSAAAADMPDCPTAASADHPPVPSVCDEFKPAYNVLPKHPDVYPPIEIGHAFGGIAASHLQPRRLFLSPKFTYFNSKDIYLLHSILII
jgi:hypothetical protein